MNEILHWVHTKTNKESLIEIKELMETEKNFILANKEDTSDFYQVNLLTKEQNKNLMYGMEITTKESLSYIVVAKNNQGIKELFKLLSLKEITLENLKGCPNVVTILIQEVPNALDFYYDYIGIPSTTKKEQVLKILDSAKKQNKKVLILNEVRYLKKEDKFAWAILMNQKMEHLKDFHLKTKEELWEEFSYLDEPIKHEIFIENQKTLINQIEKITLEEPKEPEIEESEEKLKTLIQEKVEEKYGKNIPLEVQERINLELTSIFNQHTASIYLIWAEIMQGKKSELTSSRGAVASSFIAYLLNITEFNPILENLAPEIFYGSHFDKKPDININFAYEREEILKPLEEKYNVYYLKTEKVYSPKEALKKIEDYCLKFNLTLKNEEKEALALKIVGVKMTEGIHVGRNYIFPKENDPSFLPFKTIGNKKIIQIPTENLKITSFGILEHSLLTLLEEIQNQIQEDIHELVIDNRTISLFNSPKVLKITKEEITYPFGILGFHEFLLDFIEKKNPSLKLYSQEDLIKLYGLFHGTDTWYENAQELLEKKICELKDTISSREDLLATLLNYQFERKDALKIMEDISFGRLKKENWEEYKKLMQEKKMPEWLIDSIGKIKYLFPKGHLLSYSVMFLRLAELKIDYPEIFYSTYFKQNEINPHKTREEIEQALRTETKLTEQLKLKTLLESKIGDVL